MTPVDLWALEKTAWEKGHTRIAGIDEAGRGPLAGPVVSASVILPADVSFPGINDSKQLSPLKRIALYQLIYERAVSIGVGIVDAAEIDRINILQASLLSMAMATDNLRPQPDCLLIDGRFRIPYHLPQQAVPKGDTLSISIAAASIVAKVTRDRMMEQYDLDYPEYGFSRHKGYPTRAHREAIRLHGCCPIHRRSFRGVAPCDTPDLSSQFPDE
jgi:ribonuclease HII